MGAFIGKALARAHCHPLFIPSTNFWDCSSKGLKGRCDEFACVEGEGGTAFWLK
jgi:hypothetical protein